MSYPLRIENSGHKTFVTTRTRNSEIWLANNQALQLKLLSYFAKYQEKYDVKTYALSFQGNHYHLNADFNGTSRASFMRDFNSMSARLVSSHVDSYPGGTLWGRRYSGEHLVADMDVEEYFFYCALQPIAAGLCDNIEDYPGYNSFMDAVFEREIEYTVFERAAYNEAKRHNSKVKRKDFEKKHKLKFTRLPGYEHLSKKEYRELMLKKFEKRRRRIIEERKTQGLDFMGKKLLKKVIPGTIPRVTKKSTRKSKRPLVLTKSFEVKQLFLEWYFGIYSSFKAASQKLRQGVLDVVFPTGTFKPIVYASS